LYGFLSKQIDKKSTRNHITKTSIELILEKKATSFANAITQNHNEDSSKEATAMHTYEKQASVWPRYIVHFTRQ